MIRLWCVTQTGIFITVPNNCRAYAVTLQADSVCLYHYKHKVHRKTILLLTFHTALSYQLNKKKKVLGKLGIEPEIIRSKAALWLEMVTCKATHHVLDSFPLQMWLCHYDWFLITNQQNQLVAPQQRRLRVNYSLAAFFFFLGKVDTVLLAGRVESKMG